MKEVHYFQCEYCGETFTDEDECHKHELMEAVNSAKFQAYTGEREAVAWPWDGYDFEHINAIRIDDEETWAFLDNYIRDKLGYCSPMECLDLPKKWPVVLFNTDYSDTWINIEEEFETMRILKEKYLDNPPKV